ncbi:hypothetical protein [Paraeggerthella sp. Marseille-Q4926]|uniref:hypothetical protein n=1 Tax=Paraeggerthella sp. Marseille-Q4926 TaxID=2866587 RepID=UPI001CE46C15|nr:hypothetical protein [Paraeggerthella sp. Marseille-Q4926]
MGKRLLAMVTALVLACSLVPSVAFADEGGGTPIPVTIQIGENGAPVDTSGTGWTYESNKLILQAGYAFTLTGRAFDASGENRVRNSGVIVDGIFANGSKGSGFAVRNETGGVIQGGTFNARVGNAGTIQGGTFGSNPNDPNGPYVSTSGGTITGGEFNCLVMGFRSGSIEGGTFEERVDNHGTIAGGAFADITRTKPFCYTVNNYGSIKSGAFSVDVNNDEGGSISGGTFDADASEHGYSNSVTNSGTIGGGMFNVDVNNSGAIEGAGTFNAYVQNGNARFDADRNKSCIISGGTFNSEEMDNFGTIEGGTFSGVLSNNGTISGGAFRGQVENDEGIIKNGLDAAGDPVIPCFSNPVTNGTGGSIEGGLFEQGINVQGGTTTSCTFPVRASLTGLSLAETGAEQLVATYQKDSQESNHFTLAADTGYTLPTSVSVRLGSADGQELVAGADYTYDAATGVVAIKKSAVTGPLHLAASGVPVATPPTPAPTNPENPATPAPLPEPPSNAKALASTDDSLLPSIVLSVVLIAGTTTACAAVRRRKRSHQR